MSKYIDLKNSKRVYRLVGFERGTVINSIMSLAYLLSNEDDTPEAVYALQEKLDEILDLKVGEFINVITDRDDPKKQSVGILMRTN